MSSSGNVVLCSFLFDDNPLSGWPVTHTLLSVGNYWIEEIDIFYDFAVAAIAGDYGLQLTFLSGGAAVSVAYFLAQFPVGGSASQGNVFISARPRIFVPRGNSLTYQINTNNNVTEVLTTTTVYGRSLP